jgi:hypothetical protein
LRRITKELNDSRHNSSFFNQLFFVKTIIKYTFDHHQSFSSENNVSDLSLSIKQNENDSLDKCLKFFFKDIFMIGYNQYIFTNGNLILNDNAQISTLTSFLHQILHIQFNLFYFDIISRNPTKISKNISFYEEIDLSKYYLIEIEGTIKYKLYIVLNHSWNLNYGHFVANMKVKMILLFN